MGRYSWGRAGAVLALGGPANGFFTVRSFDGAGNYSSRAQIGGAVEPPPPPPPVGS